MVVIKRSSHTIAGASVTHRLALHTWVVLEQALKQ